MVRLDRRAASRAPRTSRLIKYFSVACLGVAIVMASLAPAASAADEPSTYQALGRIKGGFRPEFKFIFAADSHLGYGPANQNTRTAAEDMKEHEKDAAFALVVGDITETGNSDQYALFKEITSSLPFPVMGGMGNHESRWQDPQGSLLASRIGPRNYSFDCGNWHFVVLDSTYPGQNMGTLEPETLDWLKKDLDALPKTKPVAVFAHHPSLYEPSRFQDSDDAFAALLDKYPVRAFFCGHGHSFIVWKGQGRDFLMTGALMDAAYTVVEVSESSMNAYSVQVSPSGRKRQLLMPVDTRAWNGPKDPSVSPVSGLKVNYSEGVLSGTFDLSRDAEVSLQIDGGGYNPLGLMSKGNHSLSLNVLGQAKGYHRARLRVSTPDGPYFSSAEFSKDADDLAIWRQNLGSAVVGELVARGSRQVIAGTRDGKIRLLDAVSGSIVWEYNAGAAWGGGVVDGNRLYFGTAKGDVQCVDLDAGAAIWRTPLDPAGFAAAPKASVVSSGAGAPCAKRVYIGSSSGAMYGVNATTGAKVWAFQAGGAIVSAPEAYLGKVLFGAWNGFLYAVDENTGAEVWSHKLGRQVYYSPYLSPAVYDGRVFATTPYDAHNQGGLLAAFDVATGQPLWKVGAQVTMMAPSISASSELVVPGSNGSFYAFSPADGSVLWRMDGSSSLFSASPGPGPEYVSGGYRGVVTLMAGRMKADFKVSDTCLFVSPLVMRGLENTQSARALVVVADTAGNLAALRFPR